MGERDGQQSASQRRLRRQRKKAFSYGYSKELVFFTPSADGTYYLETGVGPRRSVVNTVDQLVSGGACGTLPDADRQVNTHREWKRVKRNADGSLQENPDGETIRQDYCRHPDYDGFWVQTTFDGVVESCYRRWMTRQADNSNVWYGGVYTVYAVAADDYSADTSTTGVIAPGGKKEGYLYQTNGANNDEDWFKVSMTRGTTYNFEFEVLRPGVCSQITGIYDSGGTMVHGPAAGNGRTSNANRSAVLAYTAPSTGTYYVGVDEFGTAGDYSFYGSQYRLSLSN